MNQYENKFKIGSLILAGILILLCIYLWKRKKTPMSIGIRKSNRNPFWMTHLSDELKNRPINTLVIPGSHDSGMYDGKNIGLELEGQPEWAKFMRKTNFTKKSAENWAVTQRLDILSQLEHGIRYLDIRVGWSPEINEFVIVHSFAGPTFKTVLNDIKQFSRTNPTEMVLLHIKPYYTDKDKEIIELIKSELDESMVDNTMPVNKTSINDMVNVDKSIFVFNDRWSESDRMFHHEPFFGRWVDSDNIEKKKKSFIKQVEFFTSNELQNDGIMLLDWTYTAPRGQALLSTYKLEECSNYINNSIDSFFESLSPENRKSLGVITMDFFDNSNLVDSVIKLNQEM